MGTKKEKDAELVQVSHMTEIEIGDEIAKCRIGIHRKVPGLGALAFAFELGVGEEFFKQMPESMRTMYTDGRGIYVYPPFFNSQHMPENNFVFLHELGHNILGHTGGHHRKLIKVHDEIPLEYWRMAEEFQNNAFVENVLMPALANTHMQIAPPKEGAFVRNANTGENGLKCSNKVDQTWSTLEIAQHLMKENPPQEVEIQISINGKPINQPGGGGSSQGKPQPGEDSDDDGDGSGEKDGKGKGKGKGKRIIRINLLDAPPQNGDADPDKKDGKNKGDDGSEDNGKSSAGDREPIDAKIQRILATAAGMGGGALTEWIQDHYGKSEVPWRVVLDRFMMKNKPGDRFNARPNRRALASYEPETYFPTRTGAFVRGVIMVDSSGSVSDGALEKVFTHICNFLNQIPNHEVYILPHDWDAAEPIKVGPGHKLPKVNLPRGGTSFKRPLAFLRKQSFFGRMDWIIWFTDGYPSEEWPSKKEFGDKPTMWIISQGGAMPPPELGKVLYVEKITGEKDEI